MKSAPILIPAVAALLAMPIMAQPKAGQHSAGQDDGGRSFFFPSTGVVVQRQAVLLGIDEYLLPVRENVSCYISKPNCLKEPVLLPDKENPRAPDQVAAQFYGTVLRENGKYRMWYYGLHLNKPGDAYRPETGNLREGPVCYAESDDGIRWKKINLGQLEIRGSKDNNGILLPEERPQGNFLIRDETDPDPKRRYKMFYECVEYVDGRRAPRDCRTAVSPDGIHWTGLASPGLDHWLEPGGFYQFNGLYIANGHNGDPREGSSGGGRQGKSFISPDFNRWLTGDVAAFLLPEPADPEKRGSTEPYDQVHIGVSAASFGNVVVGFYGIWHNFKGEENVPFESKRWFGHGKTSCDLGLVISNDGLHFREAVVGRPYISRYDAPATPLPDKDYPTILTAGNGILNVGDETRIYFGSWLNADRNMGYSGEVRMATLPRDRWGGIGLYGKKARFYKDFGSVWSAPVRLPVGDCRVVLNADQSSRMTIEISDDRFQLLPDYSGTQSGRTTVAGGFDCAVTWPAKNLAALGGQTVRFKVNMKAAEREADPRLYAVYLRSE